jgi:hypothetical protein
MLLVEHPSTHTPCDTKNNDNNSNNNNNNNNNNNVTSPRYQCTIYIFGILNRIQAASLSSMAVII